MLMFLPLASASRSLYASWAFRAQLGHFSHLPGRASASVASHLRHLSPVARMVSVTLPLRSALSGSRVAARWRPRQAPAAPSQFDQRR